MDLYSLKGGILWYPNYISKKRKKEKDKGEKREVAQSCPTLRDPMDSSLHQAPPPMGFSRQEYWSGLPFPSPGNLPDPGIEPRSPALSTDTLTSEPQGSVHIPGTREVKQTFKLVIWKKKKKLLVYF